MHIQATEEKNRRKDEKKAARSKDIDADNNGSDEEVARKEAQGSEPGFDGIASLSAKRLINAKAKVKDGPVQIDEEDEEEIPVLINSDLPNLKTVLDQADVIVEVLDARDPLSFRSSYLEELAASMPKKRILLVLNKIGMGLFYSLPIPFLMNAHARCMPSRSPDFMDCSSTHSASNSVVPLCLLVLARWS